MVWERSRIHAVNSLRREARPLRKRQPSGAKRSGKAFHGSGTKRPYRPTIIPGNIPAPHGFLPKREVRPFRTWEPSEARLSDKNLPLYPTTPARSAPYAGTATPPPVRAERSN
jgi:hypothetical protein